MNKNGFYHVRQANIRKERSPERFGTQNWLCHQGDASPQVTASEVRSRGRGQRGPPVPSPPEQRPKSQLQPFSGLQSPSLLAVISGRVPHDTLPAETQHSTPPRAAEEAAGTSGHTVHDGRLPRTQTVTANSRP